MMFEPLSKFHDRTTFDCGHEAMNAYLRTMANQHAKKGISITHILAENGMIKAFYTLSNMQITNNHMIKGYPNDIPAILIGRIAINKPYQGQGLLKEVFISAFTHIKKMAQVSGIAFIVIDAKTEQLAQYYQSLGFVPLVGHRLIYAVNKIL